MSSQEGAGPPAPDAPEAPAPAAPVAVGTPASRVRLAIACVLVVVLGVVGWRMLRPVPAEAPALDANAAAEPESLPVLAETIGEEGHLSIAVVSLDRVASDTVELRLAVTNTSPPGSPALDITQRFSADGPDQGTLAEVYLADLSHERKLFVLRDDKNAPLGSRDTTPLAAGERRVLWARYPAPGKEEEVVVHVPHADPMPNVPVGTR